MYIRNCPSCNKEIIYKHERQLDIATARNTCCISCAKSGNTLATKFCPELWVGVCNQCGIKQTYKSWRSWYNSNHNLKVKTHLCVSCSQKNHPGHPHTEKHKLYMKQKITGLVRSAETREKIKNSHWSKNAVLRKQILENHSKHMAELISSGQLGSHKNYGFKFGHYYSKKTKEKNYYRSSYELRRMIELDNDVLVIKWTTKHKIRIPYNWNGLVKNYVPDFLIEYIGQKMCLEEVKGWINDAEQIEAKSNAAIDFCNKMKWEYKLNKMKG